VKLSVLVDYDVDADFLSKELGASPLDAAFSDLRGALHRKGSGLGSFKVLEVKEVK
jgi:hypothetical protein